MPLFSLVFLSYSILIVECIWIDKYNTIWDTPGIGQWENLPIGNGDLVANVWLQNTNNLKLIPSDLSVTPCLAGSNINNQSWTYNATTKLLENQNECVIATGNSNPVETASCDLNNNDLQWDYNNNKELVSVTKKTCLDIFGGGAGIKPIDEYQCEGATNQQWTINSNTNQIKSVRFPSECLTASSPASNGSNYNLWFAFGKSDSYDLVGERLKMIQLQILFDPPINNDNSFKETLFLSNATIIIQDDTYFVKAYIDRNDNTLNVQSYTINDKEYSITATINSWRKEPNFNPGKATGEAFCGNRNTQQVPLMNDVLLNNGCSNNANQASQTIFYHRNNYKNNGLSEWDYNLKLQSLSSVSSKFKNPYYNLTFGGVLYLSDSKRTNINGSLSAQNVKSSLLTFHVLTKQTVSLSEWLNEICSKTQKTQKTQENMERVEALHNTQWNDFWNRSQIDITNENNYTLFLVSELYNEQRYLDALDGYSLSNKSIKFNGQSFWIDTGNGPDFKSWASGYWWQNTRQPYYNTLVAGDNDMNVAFYNHYLSQLPLIKERNLIWLNHSGGFFGETAMWTGLFQESTYGYACGTNTVYPLYNVIRWLRYHWVGGLELINLLLDEYDFLQNDNIVTQYLLPISDVVLTHFYQHFTKINSTTNRIIMYPSQSLETWQCPSVPPDPKNCVTNPTEQIAGLKVVTQRLLKLPSKFSTAEERELWQNILTKFPDYSLMKSKDGATIISPGEVLPPSNTNSENTELYTVHPFRIYMSYKSNLTLAVNTFKARRFPCNDGWCQDVIDAAMLGLVDEASSMVIQRAQNSKQGYKWKWSGYTGHFQDYEPSLDHLDFMRTSIHYMIMQTNFETNQVYLFPSWPCDWSITLKIHAINNTVITFNYDGVNKKVNNMSVIPTERTKDVQFVNCVSNM